MPVQEGDYEDTLRLDQIDEAIGTHDELPEARKLRIGNPVPAVGEADERLRCVNGELSEIGCIGFRVLGDELDGGYQIVDGGVGPDYLASHLERRFFTCSWLWTRPAAAASMLRWTFWRT